MAEPRFPKSLYLIRPLFTTYELNPVASTAQASVPIPEGLDLDAWIVPSQQDRVIDEDEDVDDMTRKAKKSKKGKGKETDGGKVKSGKRRKKDEEPKDNVMLPELDVETAEERAERERVGFLRLETALTLLTSSLTAKSRASGTTAGRPLLYN